MLAEAAAKTRSFAAAPDRIVELDNWIERTGAAWRVPEDVLFRGRVCVAEIAANLLEHGARRSKASR
jgi:anti-sigma regulatory factor (Ser/Thr protein kinase)